jgi:hypothetical protein
MRWQAATDLNSALRFWSFPTGAVRRESHAARQFVIGRPAFEVRCFLVAAGVGAAVLPDSGR